MNNGTQRVIVRWLHLICSIPIIGYIYAPFADIPNYAPATRFVFFPLMLLSGLWMWKGHVVRRLFSRKSASDYRRDALGSHTGDGKFGFRNQELGS